MSRRLRSRVLALLVVAVSVLAAGARPAWAHAGLESSTPAANSVLEESPTEIVLDFDEAIEADLTSIGVYDIDGRSIETGQAGAGADDTSVRASVPQLDDGVFAVVWRITSADGHVLDGAFSFQVGTATAGDGQELIDRVREGVRAGRPSDGRMALRGSCR